MKKLILLLGILSGIAIVGCAGPSEDGAPPAREGKVETTAPPTGAVPPEQRGNNNGVQGDGG